MADFTVTLRTIPDTRAAIGRAGHHTIVIDRPEGRAGGMGLGFNGGQLLAIASAAAFATTCNTRRRSRASPFALSPWRSPS